MSVNKKNSDGSYTQYASKPYVTKDNIGLSKVENKSSEDIRGEITSKNVTDALGYTPVSEEELDKTSIPMIEVADGKSLVTEEGFAKIVDWDKNIGEYDITVCGANLFDGTVKHGVYLHSETGLEFNGTANTSCTGFIPLMSNDAFIDTSSVYNFIYRYDKDQNFIPPRQPISIRTFDDNVKYIRLASVESANFDDLIVSNSESPYEAYKSETFHITNDTLPFTIPTYSPVTNILAPSYVKTFIGENEQGKYFVDMSDKADTTELNYVKDTIKGIAEGQFIYDSEAKMTKVVPENVGKGIVAMIGGKTVKGKNLWRWTNNDFSTGVVMGGAMRIDVTLKPNTTYTLSTNAPQASDGSAAIWFNGSSSANSGVWNGQSRTIITDSTGYIFLAYRISILSVYDTYWYMLEEGSEATEYEPYDRRLYNTPVEKIIITGSNLVEKTIKQSSIDNRGIIISTDMFDSHIVKVISGRKYCINKGGDATVVGFYTSYPSVGSISYDGSRLVQNASPNVVVVTAPITGYMVFRTLFDYAPASCAYGETYYPYKEYHKEEIRIPSAILNLPDYGCSAGDAYNYVDFEEMVYHHKVGSVDMGSLAWFYYQNPGHDSMRSMIDNIKPQYENDPANILSSKYLTTTNGVVYNHRDDNVIAVANTNRIEVYSSTMGTDPNVFKESLNNVILNYELDTEELIDISDILMPFMLESGGTITFENEHNLDVPNTVIYEKEMK